MNTIISSSLQHKFRTLSSKITVLLLLCFFFSSGNIYAQTAATESWHSVYSANVKGNLTLIGNTNASCNTGATCPAEQAGTDPSNNNNSSVTMAFVDVDADATTNNSSSATFTLPSSGVVLYAGLFWGGARTTTGMDTIKFATPVAAYTTLKAQAYYGSTTANSEYQCYYDVTSLVKAGGSGTYWGAKIASSLAGVGPDAGWVLQIVYSDPSQPMRNINVYRGLSAIGTASSQTITINGFKTPTSGTVNAHIGVVGWDGDKGPGSLYLGDSLKFKNTYLSNSLNPINDIFNSSMTIDGAQFTSKNPNYVNQLGVDADIFSTTGVLAAGDTSANIVFSSGGESYILGCVTTNIDINAPDIASYKTANDLNGGFLLASDTVEYTIKMTNNGLDSAISLILRDTIPSNATYVTGSLSVSAGYNSGTKTDGSGDDQAEYDGTNKVITWRLGRTASSAAGGILGIKGTTSVKFKVKLNAGLTNGTAVNNQGLLAYTAQQTNASLTSTSYVSSAIIGSTIAGNFNAAPSPLGLGSVSSGSSKTDSISVWNTGEGFLNITNTDTLSNSMFTITPKTASIGKFDTVRFYVTFTPTSSGAKTDSVRFTHNSTGSPTKIGVSGTGTGTFYTLTVSAGANGSISPSGSISVGSGSSKVFTVTANSGYSIDSIKLDGAYASNTSPYTLSNITANHTVVASFKLSGYTITVTQGANGTISPGTTVVAPNGSQAFTFTPSTGYHIDSIKVDGSYVSNTSPYTISNVVAAHTLTATYAINTYTLTVTQGANGTIAPGTTTVNYNGSQAFTFTPSTGYHIDSIKVDGSYVGNTSPYTVSSVTANHTVTAKYAINTYTLTVTQGSNGTITPSGTTTVNYNGSQAFTFTPSTGYHIDSIKVDGSYVGNTSPYTVSSVTANHTVTATFVINTYTLTVTQGSNGTITPSGTTTVNYNGSQAFTFTPSTGYHIDSIKVDGSYVGNTSPYTVSSVTANHTVTATFAINTYTLTVTQGSNGTITPSGTTTVNYNGSQAFTFTPSTGYHIDSIKVDGSYVGNTSPYTVSSVTANHTVTATFAINTYTITITAPTNGSISPSGTVTANYGSNQAFTVTPSTGYHIDSIRVDGSYVGNTSPYTLSNITANHTVSATFAINTYTITVTAPTNGTISPSGSVVKNYGTNQAFTVTPSTGYHIDSIRVDGSYVSNTSPYTLSNITANHTVSATFAINTFTITVTTPTNGTISPSGTFSANYGSNQAFTVTPNTGYHIDSIRIDGAYVGNTSPYTLSNITANHTVSATFAINTYTLTVTQGANGTIAPGTTTVNYNGSQAFTFTPSTGYHIDSIKVDGSYVGNTSPYTVSSVTANHTITATYVLNTFTITVTTPTNGTISPSGSVVKNYGTSQAFTFTPSTGYHIDSIRVDGAYVGNTSPYTLSNITANHTVSATFAINSYTITVTTPTDGSISPSGSVSATYGSSQAFTLTPNTGYHIDSAYVDGSYVGNTSPYTLSNITADHTFSATFVINTYTITVTSPTNGSISPSGTTSVNYGDDQLLTFTPSTGYHIDSTFVDGVYVGNGTSYTISNITGNHTVSATFAINVYTITVITPTNGTLSPSGSFSRSYGSSQVFAATPAGSYHLTAIKVDGSTVSTTSPYTLSNITSNHTVSATFSLNSFTIVVTTPTNGSISPSGTFSVNSGTSQPFTFTPNTGYHLDSIFVDGSYVGNTSPYTLSNITANHTVSATFAINTYTITVTAPTNGTITPAGSTTVNYGSSQNFTATPATGYHIDSIFVDGGYVSNTSPYTLSNITGNHTVSATFGINSYTITVTTPTNGTISPNGSFSKTYGSSQAFSFTPATGYHVDSIFVDGNYVANSSPYTLSSIAANHTVSATFAINSYTVTTTTPTNGSISPSGTTSVNYGGSLQFTFTPATGYHLDSIFVDGSYVGNSATYDLTNITGNHTISATFTINSYTVTATTPTNGSISPSGATSVNYGGSQQFTFTPATGYHLDSIFVDGSYVGSSSTYDLTNITGNHTISATFAINSYTVTATTPTNGSISPSGATSVNYGGSQQFTFTPATGYHLDSIFVDGSYVGNSATYNLSNITGNHTISATFAINSYTVTATTPTNGSISPSGTTSVNYGGSQQFTFTPATGYHLDSIFVDGSYVGSSSTYDLTNITGHHTISATFAINTFSITVTTPTNGTASPSGTTNVNYGGGQTFTFTPDNHYLVDSVFVDGVYQGNSTSLSLTNITGNHTVRVTFTLVSYSITVTQGAHGSISPSGTVVKSYGSSQVFTFTPDATYHVDSIFVDGVYSGHTTTYTLSNIVANHTVTAKFSNQITVTINDPDNGGISPSGTLNNVTYGDSLTFTVTPDSGYQIDSIFVNGVFIGNTSPFTVYDITTNIDIDVKFRSRTPIITSLNPANRTYGDTTITLTINGSNFISGVSVVRMNGVDRTTTYISFGRLTIVVPASELLTVGTSSVTVFNSGGGGLSNAKPFTVDKANQSITLDSIPNKIFGAPRFVVHGTLTSGLALSYSIASGPATISNDTVTITGGGNIVVGASQSGNANYNAATSVSRMFTVSKAAASLSLGNLTVTYNGNSHSPTATTVPAGLSVTYTFNGSSTAPTNVGTYTVIGTISSSNYFGADTAILTINKATATITFGNLSQVYNGTQRTVTTTTNPAGLTVNVLYNGSSSTGPIPIGSYSVSGTIVDANYEGSGNATLTITKAIAVITLSNLNQTFNGTPRPVTATIAPQEVPMRITYNGSTTAPTVVGSYPVFAIVTDSNYIGSTNGTLVIGKAHATVNFTNLIQTYDGTPRPVITTTSPWGLVRTVTYNGSTTAPINAGTYTVIGTIFDNNYQGVDTATLLVNKAIATVTFDNLIHTYNGQPKTASVTTTPEELTVSVTYASSSNGPVNAGSYPVEGTISDANYTGTGNATLVIKKALATLTLGNLNQVYDGNPKSITVTTNPINLATTSVTYDGEGTNPINAGSHSIIATLTNANYYAINATGILVIQKANTSLSVITNHHTIIYGDTVAFTSTVTPAVATGKIVFFEGATPHDSVNSNNGTGTISTSNFSAGNHIISAVYSGNANYNGSVSGTDSVNVLQATFSISTHNLDFGEVYVDETSSDSIVLSNLGTASLRITSEKIDSGEFTVLPLDTTTRVLESFEGQSYTIWFHPTKIGPRTRRLIFTHNAGGPDTVILSGLGSDTSKYRTFKSDIELAGKTNKILFKKVKTGKATFINVLKAKPNLNTAVQRVFRTLGSVNPLVFLGYKYLDPNLAKKTAYISFGSTLELRKFYTTVPQTGTSYPIDSLRKKGKKSKASAGRVKPVAKYYNNIGWEHGIIFSLNIFASELALDSTRTTPKGFGDLLLDTNYTLFGRQLKGYSMKQIKHYFDSLETFYKEFGITDSAHYKQIDDFAIKILKRINESFYAPLDSTNFSIDDTLACLTNKHGGVYNVNVHGVRRPYETHFLRAPSEEEKASLPLINYADNGISNEVPNQYTLNQNYPNPFNPTTTISFYLDQPALVTLTVFDVLGREVQTLVHNQDFDEGTQQVQFDASRLSSGVYFYRLNINNGEFSDVKKLMLIK